MTRVSFDWTKIEENLLKKYVHDLLEGQFSVLLYNKKRPSEFNYQTRMIDQLEQEL